ncbi:MAG: class II glutamine amidotransferase [Nannocystaceae bacterium]
MCRFALYLGPPIRLSALVTEPSNSIIHQSYDAKEREEPLNGDGFGVAWYAPELREAPAVFKSVTPAWNNVNLLNLAPVTVSHCLLAHVRAATPGLAVTQLNCHPFVRGRLAFMHNGAIAGFPKLRRRLQEGLSDSAYLSIQGTTDSEHILAVIADALDSGDAGTALERMATAVEDAIRRVEALRVAAGVDAPSFLNLVLTDGARAVVSRYVSPGHSEPPHSLYSARGRLVIEEGEGRLSHEGEVEEHAVLIASEPLGPRRHWEAVPHNHLVLVDRDGATTLRPLADVAS